MNDNKIKSKKVVWLVVLLVILIPLLGVLVILFAFYYDSVGVAPAESLAINKKDHACTVYNAGDQLISHKPGEDWISYNINEKKSLDTSFGIIQITFDKNGKLTREAVSNGLSQIGVNLVEIKDFNSNLPLIMKTLSKKDIKWDYLKDSNGNERYNQGIIIDPLRKIAVFTDLMLYDEKLSNGWETHEFDLSTDGFQVSTGSDLCDMTSLSDMEGGYSACCEKLGYEYQESPKIHTTYHPWSLFVGFMKGLFN